MQDTANDLKLKRPLSPHLSIYKPQISSVLSIGHRVTGFGLYIATILMMWWFALWVFSEFDSWYFKIFDHTLIKVIIFFTIYGYSYHLSTGIRHLIWDVGIGYDISSMNFSGWIAVCSSLILTLILTYLIWF